MGLCKRIDPFVLARREGKIFQRYDSSSPPRIQRVGKGECAKPHGVYDSGCRARVRRGGSLRLYAYAYGSSGLAPNCLPLRTKVGFLQRKPTLMRLWCDFGASLDRRTILRVLRSWIAGIVRNAARGAHVLPPFGSDWFAVPERAAGVGEYPISPFSPRICVAYFPTQNHYSSITEEIMRLHRIAWCSAFQSSPWHYLLLVS